MARPNRRNWVDDLSAETREALMASGRQRRYPAETTVYCAGGTPEGVFLVLEGTAYVHLGRRDGEMLLLRIARAGEMFGGMVPLDQVSPAPVFATARTPLMVIAFQNADFARLKSAYPDMRDALLGALSVHLRASFRIMEELALLSLPERVRSRLATMAWEISPAAAAPVLIDITQVELAHMVGASRPATSKVLAQLEAQGEIALGFRTITVQPSLTRLPPA